MDPVKADCLCKLVGALAEQSTLVSAADVQHGWLPWTRTFSSTSTT